MRLVGTARSEGAICAVHGVRVEEADRFEVEPDGRTLRFELAVSDDDDLLRFQTEPENAPVTFHFKRDNGALPAGQVFLGPKRANGSRLPITVPTAECAADAPFCETPSYTVGEEEGVFIWRHRTPTGQRVTPDRETLDALKDLGYL